MKSTRKNIKNVNRKSKKQRHSKKRAVGGFNWKFWEKKPETVTDAKQTTGPEEIKPTCPPCPVCESVVHLPPAAPTPLPMPPSLSEPVPSTPLQQPPPQLGGKSRQKKRSKKYNKPWFQTGCIKK